MGNIIDGKKIAKEIREELRLEALELKKKNIVPGLAVILVGEDPASMSYVTGKKRACEEVGILSKSYELSAETKETDLLNLVEKLNKDNEINGILVQLPLPKHIDELKVINAIAPQKDVDGFHPVSIGNMMIGVDTFLPCTPFGILKLLERENVKTEGAEVVVVGRSNTVGAPVANMLFKKATPGNATVTICHTRTKNLKEHCLKADILIAAAGMPHMITKDMIKENAVVIDVGVNRVEDSSKKSGYRLIGDVEFDGAKEVASKITPVPGGVGPMTITMLMYNTVQSAIRANK
ncbi:MAG: bifunctional methylenetetrahydrofolate dehydrogenase/methenyltetrahydrofolate cyclohydrolase FolD [Spirochaetaceae bacterium]